MTIWPVLGGAEWLPAALAIVRRENKGQSQRRPIVEEFAIDLGGGESGRTQIVFLLHRRYSHPYENHQVGSVRGCINGNR